MSKKKGIFDQIRDHRNQIEVSTMKPMTEEYFRGVLKSLDQAHKKEAKRRAELLNKPWPTPEELEYLDDNACYQFEGPFGIMTMRGKAMKEISAMMSKEFDDHHGVKSTPDKS